MPAERLDNRSMHTTVLLTLVSMMEAIVIEVLVTSVPDLDWRTNADRMLNVLQVAFHFGLVLTSFMMYALVLIHARWHLGLADFLVAFGFGALQFAQIGLIGAPTLLPWYGILGLGWLVGIPMLLVTLARIARESDAGALLASCPRGRLVACHLVGGALAALGALLYRLAPGASLSMSAIVAANIAVIGFELAVVSAWWNGVAARNEASP